MYKNFRQHAEETATQICDKLGAEPTDAQRAQVVASIEQLLLHIAIDTRHWCADHAKQSSATGSKLAKELAAEHEALLANLTSMR